MKVTEILSSNERGISFEVFPPKNDTAFDSVRAATESIAELHPTFVSVTYGAGGGTSRYTLDIAENIMQRYGLPTMAHLSCISSTREGVRAQIDAIRRAGIENVMALRGDIPKECVEGKRDYRYASELVRELRAFGDEFCIGGACYPESHPESKSVADDLYYLREKVEAGVDFLTTQMFFDNAILYNFVCNTDKNGIKVPIIPGVMPITATHQVERILKLSGAFIPSALSRLISKYSEDPISMREAGIEYAMRQIEDLYANGFSNVHVYTMNKPDVAKAILSGLGARSVKI